MTEPERESKEIPVVAFTVRELRGSSGGAGNWTKAQKPIHPWHNQSIRLSVWGALVAAYPKRSVPCHTRVRALAVRRERAGPVVVSPPMPTRHPARHPGHNSGHSTMEQPMTEF